MVPPVDPRGLGFATSQLSLDQRPRQFFGNNPTDFLNTRTTEFTLEWSKVHRPAFVIPKDLPDQTIHAWIRTISLTIRYPALILVPPLVNSPWYKEFFAGSKCVAIPFARREWWISTSIPPKRFLNNYHVFALYPREH